MLADELIALGDHDRAAFIQVQLKLARNDLHKAERKALLAQEKELLAANRERWLAEDMALAGKERLHDLRPELLTFSRGFADVMTMTDVELADMRRIHAGANAPGGIFSELVYERMGQRQDLSANRSRGFSAPEMKTLIAMKLPLDGELPMSLGRPIYSVITHFGREHRLTAMQLLADAGANLNAPATPPHVYASPLHFIASERQKFCDEAALLVRNGANTRLKDESGLTVRQFSELADGPDNKLLKAINDAEAAARKAKPMSEKMPPKGSGMRRGRAGADNPSPPPES